MLKQTSNIGKFFFNNIFVILYSIFRTCNYLQVRQNSQLPRNFVLTGFLKIIVLKNQFWYSFKTHSDIKIPSHTHEFLTLNVLSHVKSEPK